MKFKEKIFYIIGMTLAVIFLSCFVITQTKYATDENEQLKFYVTKSNNNAVNKGEQVKVSIYLRNTQINGINGMRGVLEYDKNLKLVAIEYIGDTWEEKMESGSTFSNSDYVENEEPIKEIESGSKKLFCFVGNVNKDFITEMNDDIGMFTLTFDTSECVDGTTYDINWNASPDGGFGYKTYIKYRGDMYYVGGTNGKTLQTEGTSITMTGVKPSTSTDGTGEGNQGGTNQGGTNQGGTNQGGANQGEVNQGGVNQGGVNQGGVNQGGVNQGGSSQGGISQGGTNQGGTSQGGTSQGGTNQGGTSQGGTSQGGVNQGGISQGGINQGGTNQGGTNQGGSSQGGINQGGANQGGSTQSGNNQSGTSNRYNSNSMQSSSAFPQTGGRSYLYLMVFALIVAIMAVVRMITLSKNI